MRSIISPLLPAHAGDALQSPCSIDLAFLNPAAGSLSGSSPEPRRNHRTIDPPNRLQRCSPLFLGSARRRRDTLSLAGCVLLYPSDAGHSAWSARWCRLTFHRRGLLEPFEHWTSRTPTTLS